MSKAILFSVYMPAPLKKKIEQEAKTHKRSMSNLAVRIFEEHYQIQELREKEQLKEELLLISKLDD